MDFKMPPKPKTTKERVSVLWDIIGNCVLTQLKVQNLKLTFVLVLMAIIIGFLGVLIFKGV